MKRKVKLSVLAIMVCLCAALCCVGLTACGSTSTTTTVSSDLPPATGKGHEGRLETLGPAGCYGCHGYNSTNGRSQLKQATLIPLDHTNITSLSDLSEDVIILSDHAVCTTCHVYGN